MRWMLFACLSLAALEAAHADAVDDERTVNEFRSALLGKTPPRWIPGLLGEHRAHLALDAVERALDEKRKLDLAALIPSFAWPQLAPLDRVRWYRFGGIAKEDDLVANLADAELSTGLLYEVLAANLRTPPGAALRTRLERAFPQEAAAFHAQDGVFQPPSVAEVRSLFADLPDVTHYQNGAYAGKPRLFLFCRHDRNYACLLALKDKDDKPVRQNGQLWTQPGLGLSGYGKPYSEPMGNTPQGVHLIDGVMPATDDVEFFGHFRRMILDFPLASSGESEMKRLLPAATQASPWWKESAIARDVGRGELRIHGTGAHNDYPDTLFYPFIATIGCVAQLEGKYGSHDYIDQRRLLDQMMRAQGLDPQYANETQIKALLYVIDIDDKKGAVTAADLARYDIN